MEEFRVVFASEGFEVFSERWAHPVKNLLESAGVSLRVSQLTSAVLIHRVSPPMGGRVLIFSIE